MSIARIKKGDTVVVISGDDAGKSGEVKSVDPVNGTAIVAEVNKVKRAVRRSQEMPNGGYVDKEMPIKLSKLMPCAEGTKGARISRVLEGDKFVRKDKKSGRVF